MSSESVHNDRIEWRELECELLTAWACLVCPAEAWTTPCTGQTNLVNIEQFPRVLGCLTLVIYIYNNYSVK